MKPIVLTPNAVLTTPTKKVEKIDVRIKKILQDMKETLLAADNPKGVGLAATQIGIGLRIFLMRPQEKDPIRALINPAFLEKSKEMVKGIPGDDDRIEGCLSIPNVWGPVVRHESVKLRFQDENFVEHEELFTGFPATIVQHEMDHLDGILFTHRVIEQKGQLYKPGRDKNGEEILEPIQI